MALSVMWTQSPAKELTVFGRIGSIGNRLSAIPNGAGVPLRTVLYFSTVGGLPFLAHPFAARQGVRNRHPSTRAGRACRRAIPDRRCRRGGLRPLPAS